MNSPFEVEAGGEASVSIYLFSSHRAPCLSVAKVPTRIHADTLILRTRTDVHRVLEVPWD
jgi:hypothetical protein